MGQIITHVCGHEQIHYLSGFASQQERKARWLETTKCRICFVAIKQTEQAEAAVRDSAAIAHLDLPQLIGSDRQVAWATSLRASRLCALGTHPATEEGNDHQIYALVIDAKWWIDHRALTDTELLAEAQRYAVAMDTVGESPTTGVPQAA